MEKCNSILVAHDGIPSVECELPAGHQLSKRDGRPKDVSYSYKHRNGGLMWTDGGAERVAAELAAKQKKPVVQKETL